MTVFRRRENAPRFRGVRNRRIASTGIPSFPKAAYAMLAWLAAIAASASSATAKDYLVVGNPAACDLFDEYEQPMSESGKRLLSPGSPFEIVRERQLMGDQITQAMRLSHGSSTYYLLLDEKGKPLGLPPAASARRYGACTPLGDTVVVNAAAIKVSASYPPGRGGHTLEKGVSVVRVFSWRGAIFLQYSTAPPRFGWTGAGGVAFRNRSAERSGPADDGYAALHSRIMKRLDEANQRYGTLFSFFNDRTGLRKAAPRWDYTHEKKNHRYELRVAAATAGHFESSTRHIVADVERILIGKPFAARYDSGVISVSPR